MKAILSLISAVSFFTFQAYSQIQLLEKDTTSVHEVIKEKSIVNSPKTYALYKPTTVWLNPWEKVEETTYLRLNFRDQFLETWEDNKMLPASRIFAFSQDGIYYRSTNLIEGGYVFAEKLVSGNMNLYAADKFLTEGEVDMISRDANNPEYTNRMFIENSDRKKMKKSDYYYFITFNYDSTELKEIDLKTFDKKYLASCKPASDYYSEYVTNKFSTKKVLNVTLSTFLIGWSVKSVLDRYNPEFEPLHKGAPLFFAALGTLITINIIPSKKEFDKSKMIKTIALYNECH